MGEKQLEKIGSTSIDSEFFSPIPPGYRKGKCKFIVITGSVISGIGKGTFSSSLAKLLQDRGLRVEPIKVEAYLNVDAGTLNPFRHGEVYVLDDGTETDLDLGTYERFLDRTLCADNFVTSGKIYSRILEKERRGDYLGRDVQFIPHVTGETKRMFRALAQKTRADAVLIEVGGTVGDFENMYILEAVRQLRYEEGEENVCVVNLTYILSPDALGEQKSKAAQLGIKKLIELGLMPDMVLCRADEPVNKTVREKISVFSNVPLNRVIGLETMKEFYCIPLNLRKRGVDTEILKILKAKKEKLKGDGLVKWTNKMCVKNPGKKIVVGIAGKYTGLKDSYISILKALEHCEAELKVKVEVKWIDSEKIEKGKTTAEKELKGLNGVIVPPGFGKRGVEGKIACAAHAMKKNIPYLGLCLGFQMALIAFARNVLGLKEANTTEVEKKALHPVVDLLPEQFDVEGLGGNMRLGGRDVLLKEGTTAFKLYGKKTKIRERFRHRYECNPEYIKQFEEKGMVFSGKAPKSEIMQILELPEHRFFLATQFHPEFNSRPLKPGPCFLGFVKACI